MTQTTITTFFSQVDNATSPEEIDNILDNYYPDWRNVVISEEMELEAHRVWAAVLFQAVYRRYVARINYLAI